MDGDKIPVRLVDCDVHPVPRSPDDATSPVTFAFGNEASEADIREFAARFHCAVRDSYGSTEGLVVIRRDASMPSGALGSADDTIRVFDPDTGVNLTHSPPPEAA